MFSEYPTLYLFENIKHNIRAVKQFVGFRYKKYSNDIDKEILNIYKHNAENGTMDLCIAALCILVENDEGTVQHGVKNASLFLNAENLLYNIGLIPNKELYQVLIPDYRETQNMVKRKGLLVPKETAVRTKIGKSLLLKYSYTLTGSNKDNDIMISGETINFLMNTVWVFMTCIMEDISYGEFIRKAEVTNYIDLSSY